MQTNFSEHSTNVNAEQQMQNFVQPCGPWNLNMMPWELATLNAPQPGGVMQFGFNKATFEQQIGSASMMSLQKSMHKRKSSEECSLPPKQLITEERITAHFSGLHISNDYKQEHDHGGITGGRSVTTLIQGGLPIDDIPSTSTGKTDHANPAYEIAAQALKEKLRNAQRIVLCDQAKILSGANDNSVIPEQLLKTLPRPCTALIPWQPPPFEVSKMITNVPQRQHDPRKKIMDQADYVDVEIDDYTDNNNTCIMNFNKADNHMDEDI